MDEDLRNQFLGMPKSNIADLELIQIVNFSDTITLKTLDSNKYSLKIFSSGYMVSKAIDLGLVGPIK
jgi:hypothetical protein